MTTADAVRSATSPQEAMLAIAEALDRIEAVMVPADPWAELAFAQGAAVREGPMPGQVKAVRSPLEIHEDDITTEITLAKPSDEKMERRRMFERQSLRITEALGAELNDEDWNETYALGGPLWLYHGNRELVMSYPFETRRAMVADVEEDAPELAGEMARDVLKHDADETGPGRTVAMADSYYHKGVAR